MWGPSSGKLETKNIFVILASCRSCVLPNFLVALSRYKISIMHTLRWLLLHLFFGIILLDGVYS